MNPASSWDMDLATQHPRRVRRRRVIAGILAGVLILVGIGLYAVLEPTSEADERAHRALLSEPGTAETDLVNDAGPPTLMRLVDPDASTDGCNSLMEKRATSAIEYHLPSTGLRARLFGASYFIVVCLDDSKRVIGSFTMVY